MPIFAIDILGYRIVVSTNYIKQHLILTKKLRL